VVFDFDAAFDFAVLADAVALAGDDFDADAFDAVVLAAEVFFVVAFAEADLVDAFLAAD